MNSLCRSLAQIASSQATREGVFLHSCRILQCYSTKQWTSSNSEGKNATTETPLEPPPPPPPSLNLKVADWPRPKEIPFQVKVANSVNLIGYIHTPIQVEASSDGKYWAGTIITQHPTSESPPLWIPIIFEGDLAHIAACHLKEKDHVCVTGKLSADLPPSNVTQGQANVQVMVQSVNFVEGSSQMKKSSEPCKLEEGTLKHSASVKKDGDSTSISWRDLLDNPKHWWDYRNNKLNGTVKPNHPDFKHKDAGHPLWLNRAPQWVVSELEGVEFDQIHKSKQTKQPKGEESWKDLLENPNKWWDNRLDKKNVRAPDFKHKETGEALWLSNSPTWVLPKLPSVKSKDVAVGKRDTLLF